MRLTRTPGWLATLAVSTTTVLAVSLVPAPGRAATTGPGDHVLYWNQVVLDVSRGIAVAAPGPHSRAAALMYTAIYDAVNSALCTVSKDKCLGEPYLTKLVLPGTKPDVQTAIDYAAYTTLSSLTPVYPNRTFEDELAAAQAGIPDSPAQRAGRQLGIAVGKAAVANRVGDGFPDNSTYTPLLAPGYWRPTGSGPASIPNWGRTKTWVLKDGAQFRPDGITGFATIPELLRSQKYADNYDVVKAIGEFNSTVRTPDQTVAALYWANDLNGTYKPTGQLLAHAEVVSRQLGVSEVQNARLFALVALAMADGVIASFDTKYDTPNDLWRPETAIQQGDTDGNPATVADPAWQPLATDENGNTFTKPFPSYDSGHGSLGHAWAVAMDAFFGTDNVTYVGGTDDPHVPGVTRRFTSFTGAVNEQANSRIWLGVHFPFDSADGAAQGTKVGEYVVANALRAQRTCEIDYQVLGQWPGGFSAQVNVTSTSPVALDGWSLRWNYTKGQQITQIWQAELASQAGGIVVTNNAGWNGTVAPNSTVNFGFLGSWTGTNPEPTAFTLNGAPCDVS